MNMDNMDRNNNHGRAGGNNQPLVNGHDHENNEPLAYGQGGGMPPVALEDEVEQISEALTSHARTTMTHLRQLSDWCLELEERVDNLIACMAIWSEVMVDMQRKVNELSGIVGQNQAPARPPTTPESSLADDDRTVVAWLNDQEGNFQSNDNDSDDEYLTAEDEDVEKDEDAEKDKDAEKNENAEKDEDAEKDENAQMDDEDQDKNE